MNCELRWHPKDTHRRRTATASEPYSHCGEVLNRDMLCGVVVKMVGIPNASNEVGTTEPTIQRPPSPSREVEEASSILQVDSCSEDSDVESYAASIYPTTRKYRSIPRSYDLESM